MRYCSIIKDMSNKFELRLRMVRLAQEKGISEAIWEYRTTRKTIRKWLNRYQKEGLEGLKDKKEDTKEYSLQNG